MFIYDKYPYLRLQKIEEKRKNASASGGFAPTSDQGVCPGPLRPPL